VNSNPDRREPQIPCGLPATAVGVGLEPALPGRQIRAKALLRGIEARLTSPHCPPAEIAQLLAWLKLPLQHRRRRYRKWAIKVLARVAEPGRAEALALLVPLLRDPDPWVRRKGLGAIGRIPGGLALVGRIEDVMRSATYDPELHDLALSMLHRGAS